MYDAMWIRGWRNYENDEEYTKETECDYDMWKHSDCVINGMRKE